MPNEIAARESLAILWTNGDPEVAMKMAFMYARNSMEKGWWQRVRLVVWGPSALSLRQDGELQDALPLLQDAGVEVLACRACAESYGAGQALEAMGVEVQYMGEELTAMIKAGWNIISV